MSFGDEYDRDFDIAESMRMFLDAAKDPALWDILDMENMELEEEDAARAKATEAYYNSLS